MRTFLCLLAAALLLAPAPARAEEPLVQRVRKSLDDGVKYLKGKQTPQGGDRFNWENDTLNLLQPGTEQFQGVPSPAGLQIGNGVRVANNTKVFVEGTLMRQDLEGTI